MLNSKKKKVLGWAEGNRMVSLLQESSRMSHGCSVSCLLPNGSLSKDTGDPHSRSPQYRLSLD